MGFGHIGCQENEWSLSMIVSSPKNLLADINYETEKIAYCSLTDFKNTSFLWFNRPVGPIDSHEWYIVEEFLSNTGIAFGVSQ